MLFAEMAISLPTNSCRMLGKVERTVVVDTTTVISTFRWNSKNPEKARFPNKSVESYIAKDWRERIARVKCLHESSISFFVVNLPSPILMLELIVS